MQKIKWILATTLILTGMMMNNCNQEKETKKEKQINKDVQITTFETIKEPSGKVISRTIVQKSKTQIKTKEKTKLNSKKWLVGVSYSPLKHNIVTLSIDRKIIGGAYVGVYARTDKEIGVSLKWSL